MTGGRKDSGELQAFARWDSIEQSLMRDLVRLGKTVQTLERHQSETAGVHKVVKWILGIVVPMALTGIVALIAGHTRLGDLEDRTEQAESRHEQLSHRVGTLQLQLAEVKKDTSHAADMSERSYHETVRRMDRLESALPRAWQRRIENASDTD